MILVTGDCIERESGVAAGFSDGVLWKKLHGCSLGHLCVKAKGMQCMDRKAILAEAEAMKDWLVRIRRDLHAIPVPGDEEYKTQEYLCKTLEQLGIPFRKMRTAVVGLVEGAAPGAVVALRADMDALPVQEPDDRPYRSRHDGYMHACGHDAHMTVALGAAATFRRTETISRGDKTPVPPARNHTGCADGRSGKSRVDYVLNSIMPDVQAGMIEETRGAQRGFRFPGDKNKRQGRPCRLSQHRNRRDNDRRESR